MTYEAWRITYQNSEQAARAAYEMAAKNQRDAGRYRWLRRGDSEDAGVLVAMNAGEEMDEAIDAAMKGANG